MTLAHGLMHAAVIALVLALGAAFAGPLPAEALLLVASVNLLCAGVIWMATREGHR